MVWLCVAPKQTPCLALSPESTGHATRQHIHSSTTLHPPHTCTGPQLGHIGSWRFGWWLVTCSKQAATKREEAASSSLGPPDDTTMSSSNSNNSGGTDATAAAATALEDTLAGTSPSLSPDPVMYAADRSNGTGKRIFPRIYFFTHAMKLTRLLSRFPRVSTTPFILSSYLLPPTRQNHS